MSAWLCSDRHINSIVTWAFKNHRHFYARDTDWEAMAQALLDENYKSVNHRYNETDKPHSIVWTTAKSKTLTAVECIKACHCLNYQSCEHDGWESSLAKAFLDSVESAAIRAMPGYDAAPWGID